MKIVKNPTQEIIELLEKIPVDSERMMEKELNCIVKNPIKPYPIAPFLEQEKDYKFFSYEEKDGKIIALVAFQINDPVTRKNLNVEGDFILFSKAFVLDEFRNQGILKDLMTKTLISCNKTYPQLTIIACTSAKEIIQYNDNQSQHKIHVLNLDRYSSMIKSIDPSPSVQLRYYDKAGQYGRECLKLSDLLKDNKNIDHEKVECLIKDHQQKANSEGKHVMGLYLKGKISNNQSRL